MATPNKQGKAMSSRLAGMKFMQRAGASTPSTPTTPAEPPAKKQRLSNGSSIWSPATPLDSAVAADEQRRAEAVEQEAASRGETKWYLSFKAPHVQSAESPLRIVSAGYSALDAGHEDELQPADEEEQTARPQVAGRKSFGNFKKAEKKKDTENSSDEDEDDDENKDEDLEDDPTGVRALIAQGRKDATDRVRAERKAKKAADKAESQRLAEQRRKKGVNLNKMTSISSGGASGSGGRGKDSSYLENMTCHRCGEKGHMMKNCSQRGPRK